MIVKAALARERRGVPGDHALRRLFTWGGQATNAGPVVSESTALAHSTVYACVRFKARSVAQLPRSLFQTVGDQRIKAREHPLFDVLHTIANPRQTAYDVWKFLQMSLELRGNALAFIERSVGDRVKALWPIPWDRVTPDVEAEEVVFKYNHSRDGEIIYRRDEMLFHHGLSIDSVVGASPIALQRESVGHGLAMQQYGASFFANDATPGGVLTHPGKLGGDEVERKAAADRIRASWEQAHNPESRHVLAVLEEGMTYSSVSMSPDDAQYLQTRKFNRAEIAGWFGVPPHMIGDVENETPAATIEQRSLDYVIWHLMPDLVGWEQAIDRDLLTEAERAAGFFAKFNAAALLRGDSAARSTAMRTGVMTGWISRNEVRELEDRNPVEGLGDFFSPMNLATLDPETGELVQPAGQQQPGAPSVSGEGPQRDLLSELEARGLADRQARADLAASFMPVFEDLTARIVRAEDRQLRKLARRTLGPVLLPRAKRRPLEARDVDDFVAGMLESYNPEGELHELVGRLSRPAVEGLAVGAFDLAADTVAEETNRDGFDLFVDGMVAGFTARYTIASSRALRAALDPVDANDLVPTEALDDVLSLWQEERPLRVARKETVQQSRAAAKEAFRRSGVTLLRWRTRGENCPFCTNLNGVIVGIEGTFVQAGTTFNDPTGARKPITPRNPIGHPPLHKGCDCDIEAVTK